jgi:outer membrane protein TolC
VGANNLDLALSSREVAIAKTGVAQARTALALSQTSFANGLITQLTLTEAVNKLDESRIGFENAVYEYFFAYYDWEVAAPQ